MDSNRWLLTSDQILCWELMLACEGGRNSPCPDRAPSHFYSYGRLPRPVVAGEWSWRCSRKRGAPGGYCAAFVCWHDMGGVHEKNSPQARLPRLRRARIYQLSVTGLSYTQPHLRKRECTHVCLVVRPCDAPEACAPKPSKGGYSSLL